MKTFFIFPALLFLLACSCNKSDTQTTTPGPVNPIGIPVKTKSAKLSMAYKTATNPNPQCFLDLDSGAVYSVTTAPAHAAAIDLYWGSRPFYSQAYFVSPDEDDPLIGGTGTMTYGGDLKITSWSQQNHTIFEATNDITPAMFDAVKTVDQLVAEWNKDKPFLTWTDFTATSDQLGMIYTFETADHKKGLIKVTSATYGANGYAEMQIKIEP